MRGIDDKKPLRLCRPWHNSGTSLMYFPLRGGRQKLKGSAVVTMTGLGCAKGNDIVQHDQWPVKAFGQRPRRERGYGGHVYRKAPSLRLEGFPLHRASGLW